MQGTSEDLFSKLTKLPDAIASQVKSSKPMTVLRPQATACNPVENDHADVRMRVSHNNFS